MERSKLKEELISWLKAVVLAILVVFIAKTFLVANYVVDGSSMYPTLKNEDRLMVNKIGYKLSDIKHGDIIVFHATPTDDYIKRVIGLPGDTIVYKNDELYRNGKKVTEPYLDPEKKELESGNLTYDFTLEQDTGKTKVPAGELWVMGDNRRNSVDSRRFGFIKQSDVVGKLDVRYYPFGKFEWFGL
ncbi:signal peptidase I [Falsibacillus albus]|uniref:Signal peptidase I n=1 Tax=Falsibacillus albus TaxID=2478915 RepID=A0A3L7K1M9_9BACI|nr:signal peptidase I [Falsibacillus albus]RLQ94582.1 signal peptidase I [Falsibacillus albus]